MATATFSFDADSSAATGDLTASDISVNATLFRFTGVNLLRISQSNSTTSGAAYTNNEYFETTVTGSGLTITNISYKAARGGSSTPRGFALRTSNDSYATEVFNDQFATVTPTFEDVSQDVSISVGSGVTLRFYVFAPSTASEIQVEDLVITAESASGTTHTITAASLSYTPQSVNVNARHRSAVTAPALSYSGQTVSTIAETTIAVVAAALSYTAQTVTTKLRTGVVAATLTYTAQTVTTITDTLTSITAPLLRYVGKTLTTTGVTTLTRKLRGLGILGRLGRLF